jgi:mRNA interferase MazF
MTGSRFGDVVLVPFPFTDQSDQKKRPAVVVSSTAYHRERSDLILMAVTSQVHLTATVGEASIAGWKEAGLLKPSVLKPILFTLDRGVVIRKLGYLRQQDLSSLRKSFNAILGSSES